MTTTEITALLALWAEHPETAPLDVVYACGTFQTTDTTFSNVHAAALARDRLVELIVDAVPFITVSTSTDFHYIAGRLHDTPAWAGTSGPTRLLALIAAYRTMKGTR